MTDDADPKATGRRSPKRQQHDEAVARQMRENLKQRKARQRALQEAAATAVSPRASGAGPV